MNNKLSKTEKISIYIFYLAYMLYILYKTINNTYFGKYISEDLYDIIKIVCWVGFLTKILVTELNTITSIFKKKEILYYNILILILIPISLIIKENTNSSTIFELVLIGIAAYDLSFDLVIKISKNEILLITIITITSSLLGIIPIGKFEHGNNRVGYSLGFSYLGKASQVFLQNYLMSIYLNRNKENNWKKKNIIYNTILGIIMGLVSRTRNQLYMTFIIDAVMIFNIKRSKEKRKNLNIIIKYIFIICYVFTIVTAVLYNPRNERLNIINDFFNSRLEVANRVYNKIGINNFGNNIIMDGTGINENYTYIDSAYLLLLLNYGRIITILILCLLTRAVRRCIKNNEYELIIWLVSTAIASIVDNYLIQINFNCIILIAFRYIENKRIGREKSSG